MTIPRRPETMQSARLRGERIAAHHFADLRTIHDCAEAMVTMGGVRSEESSRAYLERALAHWAEHGFGFWLFYDRGTGELAGVGGVRTLDVDGVVENEIGYGLLPHFWGRGLGSEVAALCCDFARDTLGATTLVAVVDHGNTASRHVLHKAGFAAERDDFPFHGNILILYRWRAGR